MKSLIIKRMILAAVVTMGMMNGITYAENLTAAEKEVLEAIKSHRYEKRAATLEIVKKYAGQIDLNKKVYYGNKTYLNLAIEKRRYETVKVLLEAGADPNMKNGYGSQYPLRMALYGNAVRIAGLLIAHGADINVLSKSEQKRFYIEAMKKGAWSLAFKLIDEKGIDINTQDKRGETILHYAAGSGNPAVVRQVLERKAAVSIRSNRRRTPVEEAVSQMNPERFKYRKAVSSSGEIDFKKVIVLLLDHDATVSKEYAKRYAKLRYIKSGFWRFFIGTKMSIWLLIAIGILIAAGIHYFLEADLEMFGMISIGSTVVFFVPVVIIEVIYLIKPMWMIAVANSGWGWLPYLGLRLSAITALIPVFKLIQEESDDMGSVTTSSYSVNKTCSGCKGSLPSTIRRGDRCPHCGGIFGGERWI